MLTCTVACRAAVANPARRFGARSRAGILQGVQRRPDRFAQSARLQRVQPPVIPRIHRLIAEHPGTISLGQGVVGYPPPPGVRAALDRFLADADNHKYASVYGIPALRERIAAKLSRENGIAIGDEHELMVTAGGNMAFVNALLSICDEGDEVVLMSPFYFNHEMAVTMAGCRPVLAATDRDFQLDLDAVRAAVTARTRAVVTISPNNPSGAVYPRADLAAVNRLCAERGLFHVHDEAYEYFLYDGAEHFSPGSLPDAGAHTISLYSLSKAYGFASWRIGYLRMPAHLHDAAAKIQDTIAICPAIVSQFAAAAALDAGAGYCRGHLPAIAARRSAVLRTLDDLRPLVEAPAARGAFYALARVATAADSVEVASRLIREHGVAVVPGAAFGLTGGCYLRIAYAAPDDDTLAEALRRLAAGLRRIV